jgi:hypothetical protein
MLFYLDSYLIPRSFVENNVVAALPYPQVKFVAITYTML